MTDDRLVFVDTTVLLTATVPACRFHQQALRLLNVSPTKGIPLLVSGQVLREYLSVATRPANLNGLGLTPRDALSNVAGFRSRARVVAENEEVFDRLAEIVRKAGCHGKTIHDANVVATAVTHRADTIITENTSDFKRFGKWIDLVALSELANLM